MERLFLSLLQRSLSALWPVGAVLALRLVFRRAPKWLHCALWALVAVRLLCPALPQSALSLQPEPRLLPAAAERYTLADVPVSLPEAASSAVRAAEDNAHLWDNTVTIRTEAADAAGEAVTVRALRWEAWVKLAPYVWLAGVAAMLGYALLSWLRLRRRVAASLPQGDGVWLCDDVGTPFILGVVRPRIYLPSALPEAQRGLVLAHERAHLARRDHWWKPLGWALLSVHWFNPGLWLAYALLCRDIELACDERVLRMLGTETKRSYSETLLACSAPRRLISACPLAFGETGVKTRVKAVLNYKKPAFRLICLALAAAGLTAVCLLTDRRAEPPAEGPGTEPPLTQQAYGPGDVILHGADETGYYLTLAAALPTAAQESFSEAMREAVRDDWARWNAPGYPRELSGRMPGHLSRAFATAEEGAAFFGRAVADPLADTGWFTPMNWAGADAADPDGVLKRSYVTFAGDETGSVSGAAYQTGYQTADGTRITLQAQATAAEGALTLQLLRSACLSCETLRLPDGQGQLIRRTPTGQYAAADTYFVRDGLFYTVSVISPGGETSLRPALNNVLAALGAERVSENAVPDASPHLSNASIAGMLSAAEVLRLADKGAALTWSDFAVYPHGDVGSGLYLWRCDVAESAEYPGNFAVLIGGSSTETTPWYVRLIALEEDGRLTLDDDARGLDLTSAGADGAERFLRAHAAAREAMPGRRREFFDLLGLSGWYTDELFGSVWHGVRTFYVAAGDGAIPVAEAFGDLTGDNLTHAVDLDGDGVNELVCNDVYYADGAQRVAVFRRRGNVIEQGTLHDAWLRENGELWLWQGGVNSWQTHYDRTHGLTLEYRSLLSSRIDGMLTRALTMDDLTWEVYAELSQ